MKNTDFRHWKRRIIFYSLAGILISGLLITLIGILPLYTNLRAHREQTLMHQLTVRTLLAEEVITKVNDIAFQITSRSALRNELTKYNRGETGLEALREFSFPKLEDALLISDSVRSIVRISPGGKVVAEIGLALPRDLWKIPPDDTDFADISVYSGDENYLIASAPIIDNEGIRQGTDIILYSVDELGRLVYDYAGLGDSGFSLIVYPSEEKFLPLLPVAKARSQGLDLKDRKLQELFSRAAVGRETGISYNAAGSENLAVYGPIRNVDWALMIMMESTELFLPINRRMVIITVIIVIVLAASMMLLRYLVHPLVTDLSVSARHFQKEVEKKTQALMRELEERKQMVEELKRARDKAESADRAKSEFLANMSHEIRTPLTGIIGMIDIVLSDSPEGESREYLQMMKDSASILNSIINDILDFSRIEAGKIKINPETVDVSSFLESITAAFRIQAERKKLAFRLSIDPQLPEMLRLDRLRFSEILSNLLSNAVKFTEEGSIYVAARRAESKNGDFIEVSVQDTGIGIAADDKEKLFSSFTQLDGSTTKQYAGSGLGLVISRRLARMMGGEIQLESKTGSGSTFICRLPLIKAVPQQKAESDGREAAQQAEQNIGPLSVLLAEDNKINQVFLTRILQKRGHLVTLAENGEEAVRLFEKGSFNVVLMDIQMPVMDGLEACRKIRRLEESGGLHTAIIALTAYAMEEDRQRIVSAGMDDYVSKPVDSSNLFETIARNLSRDR